MVKKYYSVSLSPVCNRLLMELVDLGKEYHFQITSSQNKIDINKCITQIVVSYLKYTHLQRCMNRTPRNEPDFEYALWSFLIRMNPDIDFTSPRITTDEHGYQIALDPISNIVMTNVIAALSEACNQYILSPLGYISDIDWLEWEVTYTSRNTVLIVCAGDYRIKRYHELVRNGIITQ